MINKAKIRGLFVNTHIKAVQKQTGEEGLERLRRGLGQPLKFSNLQYVPVADEVGIINSCLRILAKEPVPESQFDYEAGRLHLENFRSTALGRLLLSQSKGRFKNIVMSSPKIARQVFENLPFGAEDLGKNQVRVVMENSDYPLEHFAGFFEAWLSYLKLVGLARAKELAHKQHEYTITWKEAHED